MLRRRASDGFSLIELMIGIALLALLMSLGLPAFSTYLQNAKLRSAAENFYVGVQKARSEAVRLNAQVEIVLTNDAASVVNANTGNLSATGQNWIVRALDPATGLYSYIDGKSMLEGSGQTSAPSVQIDGGGISLVAFKGLGATTLASAATFAFTNPAGGACAALGGPMRCLNVVVSIGGQARMCDPAVIAAGDTRKC
jgi:type IV fimbrial biogenesis protein FimT